MSDATEPRRVLGLLAHEARRRVIAALVLGADTIATTVAATGLTEAAVVGAFERLAGAGIVERVPAGPTERGGTLRLVPNVFEEAARRVNVLAPRFDPTEEGATPEQARGLRNFLNDDGGLRQIPAGRAKREPVLDFLAQRFEPGEVYSEKQVNLLLGRFHADTAALRRYLVDEGFMERRDGLYWRAGGTFEVAVPAYDSTGFVPDQPPISSS